MKCRKQLDVISERLYVIPVATASVDRPAPAGRISIKH